jgi:secretion/DNA translocation related TadE-like protein
LQTRNESGQVTVLAIALFVGLLALLPIAANISNLLIAQQRLNSLADASALAGAQELEFNNPSACEVAASFVNINLNIEIFCSVSPSAIQVALVTSAPKSILNPFISKLSATARAGIADTNSGMP